MISNRRETIQQVGSALLGATGLQFAHAANQTEQTPIKIGQIGVGHAHASKLSVYRDSADYDVVGVVEPDPVLRQQAKTQAAFRDLPWMTEEQLLNTAGLQAVLVETRVRDLLDTAERCVAAGMHIHLDKPAGQSLPQFRRILESAKTRQLLVQMGYMYRYNPGIVLLRHFLQQGWLGDVFEVHTVMSKVVSVDARQELAEYPGGMMFELGCHILDLVIGILGRPTQVVAHLQHASQKADGLADNTLAVLTYPRALATVKSSAMEVEGFSRRHLVVCGTEGTFQIQPLDNPSATVSLSLPRRSSTRGNAYAAGTQQVSFPKFTRYVADAADMAQIIRGEKLSDFGYEHDLTVQRTLLQACNLPLE